LRDTLIDLHNYAAMALMESEPTVPNLPSNIIGSNIPLMTNYEPFSEPVLNTRVRKSLSDPPVPNLPSKIISSNVPSMTNYEPFSEPVLNMHMRRSLSDPPVPNLLSKTISSNVPSNTIGSNIPSKIISTNIHSMNNYEPFSEPVLNMRVRRSLSDPPLQSLSPVMRASMSEMDQCINLR